MMLRRPEQHPGALVPPPPPRPARASDSARGRSCDFGRNRQRPSLRVRAHRPGEGSTYSRRGGTVEAPSRGAGIGVGHHRRGVRHARKRAAPRSRRSAVAGNGGDWGDGGDHRAGGHRGQGRHAGRRVQPHPRRARCNRPGRHRHHHHDRRHLRQVRCRRGTDGRDRRFGRRVRRVLQQPRRYRRPPPRAEALRLEDPERGRRNEAGLRRRHLRARRIRLGAGRPGRGHDGAVQARRGRRVHRDLCQGPVTAAVRSGAEPRNVVRGRAGEVHRAAVPRRGEEGGDPLAEPSRRHDASRPPARRVPSASPASTSCTRTRPMCSCRTGDRS